MNDDGYKQLCCAIIAQAIKDYQKGDLKEKHEVIRFLKSDWCDWMLPDGVSGKDIHRRIKKVQVIIK